MVGVCGPTALFNSLDVGPDGISHSDPSSMLPHLIRDSLPSNLKDNDIYGYWPLPDVFWMLLGIFASRWRNLHGFRFWDLPVNLERDGQHVQLLLKKKTTEIHLF